MFSGTIKKIREQASGAIKGALAEPLPEGPTEAGVYKNLLVEMQFQQLVISREYQELFKQKEEEIRRLKTVVGEPVEEDSAKLMSPKKEQGAKPMIDLSPEDIKVVLKEWEKKMKNNIIQKTEALAEAQIYRESVDLLRSQLEAFKETIKDQQLKLESYASRRGGNGDLVREQHEAAMQKIMEEFSSMQAEATKTKEKLVQAELEVSALKTKAESDAKTLEILSKNAPSDGSDVQTLLQERDQQHMAAIAELKKEAASKQSQLEEQLKATMEQLTKANEELENLRADLQNAFAMQTDMISRTKKEAEEEKQSLTLEKETALKNLEEKEAALKDAMNALTRTEADLHRITKEHTELVSMRNVSSQQEVEMKEAALESARQDLYAAQRAMDDLKISSATALEEVHALLKEKSSEIDELKSKLDSLGEEKDVLAGMAAKNLEEANAVRIEKDSQAKKFETTLTEVQNDAAQASKYLQDQLDKATAEARESKSRAEETAASLMSITDKLANVNEELALTRRQLEKATEERMRLEQDLVGVRSDLARLQSEMLDMKRQLDETAERIRRETDKVRQECFEEQERRLKDQSEAHLAELSKVRKEVAEYKDMYMKETTLRRQVHDELMDMKGNIRVFARVRPVLPDEKKMAEERQGEGGADIVTEFPPESVGRDLVIKREGAREGNDARFEFDRVFDPASTQEQVFDTVNPLITSVMDGVNVTLFAYGQTGSGKTFTMEGTKESPGVNIRALQRVFDIAEERSKTYSYTFTVSVLEVYLETILDLLGDVESKDAREKLDIRQNPDSKMVFVQGLVKKTVSNMKDCGDILALASKNRTVGAHNMNEHSSRSHLVFTLTATALSLVKKEKFEGNLNLIDLAGSERIGKTDATGDRLKEAQSINKSLSALGDVINALSLKNSHIPFRNSKLTYLLQDQLSGNAKVGFFANVSPTAFNSGETICTLNFANRCRKTELGKAKKNVTGGDAAAVEQLSKENAKLKRELEELRGGGSSRADTSFTSTPSGTPVRTPSKALTGSSSGIKRGLDKD